MRVLRSTADRVPWTAARRSRRDVVKTMSVARGGVLFACYGKPPRAAAEGTSRITQ